jgi:hypothetical protein
MSPLQRGPSFEASKLRIQHGIVEFVPVTGNGEVTQDFRKEARIHVSRFYWPRAVSCLTVRS